MPGAACMEMEHPCDLPDSQRYQPWKLVAWSKKVKKMLKSQKKRKETRRLKILICSVETYEKGRGWNYWCQDQKGQRNLKRERVEVEEIE